MNTAEESGRTTTFEALLGILSLGPMTGYEVRQRIEVSIGNFWSESFGQIYPALNKLRREGLVEAAEAGKKGRKVYSLTPAGRTRLKAWLAVIPPPRKLRDEMLLKVFFGGQSGAEVVRAQVAEARARHVADLERYDSVEPFIRERHGKSAGLPYFLMVLNHGRMKTRALVAWADETLAALDEIAASTREARRRDDDTRRSDVDKDVAGGSCGGGDDVVRAGTGGIGDGQGRQAT